MIADIKRPALRYFGSKFRCANRILKYFPEHAIYVEPFGGSAALLLRKQRSAYEIYNDLNDEVYEFFYMLRKYPRRLIRLLSLTPHSREEFEKSLIIDDTDDAFERCRKFYVRSWQSYMGSGNTTNVGSWRQYRYSSNATLFPNADNLYNIVDRIKTVTFEHIDAMKCIQRYDTDNTLFYIDPPYIKHGDSYITGIDSKYHDELSNILHTIKGLAIISTTENDVYIDMYKDWTCASIKVMNTNAKSNTELLYMNFELA
jgi:DNA adenine methylase